MRQHRDRRATPWHLYVLAVIAIALIVLAITEIGPPTSSARTSTETVEAANGVIQTTVSAPASDVPYLGNNASFQAIEQARTRILAIACTGAPV